ncbi:MAG: hypothetical protein WCK67_12765 [bacterium]
MTTELQMSDLVAKLENSENIKEFLETHILETKVKSAVDVYMKLVNSEIEEDNKQNYKTDLQKDFLNYIRSNDIQVEEVKTAECIAKTAFSRLKNASENYYINKLNSIKDEKLNILKLKAEQMKKEYELVKTIR